jgi:hypothetical protein
MVHGRVSFEFRDVPIDVEGTFVPVYNSPTSGFEGGLEDADIYIGDVCITSLFSDDDYDKIVERAWEVWESRDDE